MQIRAFIEVFIAQSKYEHAPTTDGIMQIVQL